MERQTHLALFPNMGKKNLPFRGYTEKEVRRMENGYYCLVLGGDFVLQDKFYLFTEREISKLYEDTLENLLKIIEDGDEKDKQYAISLIPGLLIQPMRLH